MNFTFELIVVTILVSGAALGYGWIAAHTRAVQPTFGDVLIMTAMSSGIPAFLILSILWWVLG